MRIAYLITQSEQGGAQTYVLSLAKSMKELGHEVFVITGKQSHEKDKWLFDRLRAANFPEENLLQLEHHKRDINILEDIKSVSELYQLLKQIKPDLLHANSSKGGIVASTACFFARIPDLYTVHGFVFLEPQNLLKKTLFVFMELFSSFIRDFTIVMSKKDTNEGRKYFILRNFKKYELVYIGLQKSVEENMIERVEARRFFFGKFSSTPEISDSGQILIGNIANFYKTKGLEYMIESAKKVLEQHKTNVLFLVMGGGDKEEKDFLQNKINANGLENNFFLLGSTPDASKYLKGLDRYLLTSVKEGLPYCLLEAAAAGLPIISTNVGGIKEMAEGINIKLAEAKNVEEISRKVLESISENNTQNEIPEIFTYDFMLNKTLEVYKKLI